MKRIDRFMRNLVPALPVLSRQPFMRVLDWFDKLIGVPFREARHLPPNRFRLRIGVGNRIFFNHFAYKYQSVDFWFHVFASQMATMESNIVDIGCGCGRYATLINTYQNAGHSFRGQYTGIDVDEEMLQWCRKHFPPERFRFHHANVYNRVYNPSGNIRGSEYRLPLQDGSQHFVFSNSLHTHLLETDLRQHVHESYRVLVPAGWMQATVFCVDTMRGSLGGRWTFAHPMGNALVESLKYPEAAVAYRQSFLLKLCKDAGFNEVRILPDREQSLIQCQK
jgi:SAM-dependent methyltransferase